MKLSREYLKCGRSNERRATDNHRPAHMSKLFHTCKAPKVWKELPNGSHNDTVAEPHYFQYIDDFLRKYVDR